MVAQWTSLARGWQLALLGSMAVFLAGSSVAGVKMYGYVEHDNAFCSSCHLMNDAFSRFQLSAHSQIECHNCHQASPVDRASMLYANLVAQSGEVERHANVPNRVCEDCHVRGDPDRWRQIAATAGHRVHLESRDSSLRELRCVTCHSTSLHQFASVDQTCGQSGCHNENTIKLGAMSQVDLHCTTCHNFLTEAPGMPLDSLGRPLTPRAQQCLSCHGMRQRVQDLDIGLDPHKGVCGDCHNPHTQASPSEISCATSACHTDWRTVSFHVGVPHPEQCRTCHIPHSWRVEGENCIRCHQDIDGEPAGPRRSVGSAHSEPATFLASATPGTAGHRWAVGTAREEPIVRLASATTSEAALLWQVPETRQTPRQGRTYPRFSHRGHREQPCTTCHNSQVRHGALVVQSQADCQRCHHTRPGREVCANCHAPASRRPTAGERTLTLSGVSRTVTRSIRFDHQRHTSVTCTTCHSNGLTRAPENADCGSCHAQHHGPNATCTTCHGGANPAALHTADNHATCASAACHGAGAQELPVSREACLVCHTAQTEHVPNRQCNTCHRVTTRERE